MLERVDGVGLGALGWGLRNSELGCGVWLFNPSVGFNRCYWPFMFNHQHGIGSNHDSDI